VRAARPPPASNSDIDPAGGFKKKINHNDDVSFD
jgi:hypothetical protein